MHCIVASDVASAVYYSGRYLEIAAADQKVNLDILFLFHAQYQAIKSVQLAVAAAVYGDLIKKQKYENECAGLLIVQLEI